MKLNFVGIVCTTAVLLYLLVTCTTANADDGFCCQVVPCNYIVKSYQYQAICNGTSCIIEVEAYESCTWYWCSSKSTDPFCLNCRFEVARLKPIPSITIYSKDVIPSWVEGSLTTCSDACIEALMGSKGSTTSYKICNETLPNK